MSGNAQQNFSWIGRDRPSEGSSTMPSVRAHLRNGSPVSAHYRRLPEGSGGSRGGGIGLPELIAILLGIVLALAVLLWPYILTKWIAVHWWNAGEDSWGHVYFGVFFEFAYIVALLFIVIGNGVSRYAGIAVIVVTLGIGLAVASAVRPGDPAVDFAGAVPPGKVAAPVVLSRNLGDVEYGEIEAIDIAKDVVDDEKRRRVVLKESNWTVVAQCPYLVDGKLRVGVVKNDEDSWVSDRGIRGNKFASYLDC